MPTYEMYALNYAGPLTSSRALLMGHKDWDTIAERSYFVYVLKNDEYIVVVDAGMNPEEAARRQLDSYTDPRELLARIGIKAEEVEHLIITHLHFDHANGINLFPNAKIYLQKEEFRFWLKDPISEFGPFQLVGDENALSYVAGLGGSDCLHLVDGDQKILPGISCLLVPGHEVRLTREYPEVAPKVTRLA